uniref:Large ribosomal subunit protein bL21c n=1 Tax=Polysiphonia sertularioides TaxID=945028 RepID=A0A1Z1MFP9_9FLOR|nr:ribosomal protein L21 [Polysiphonia sertularioides]
MTYAVLDVSGTQIIVESGKFYDVNHLNANPGDIVHLNRVLFLKGDDNYLVGKPCINSVHVKAIILKHFNNNKVTVFKFKRKKNSRLKKGHRQKLTRIFIQDIIS